MESQKPDAKSDEIDLGALFSKIGDFFGNAWLNFMRFLAIIRRVPFENKLSFFLIIFASVAIGTSFTIFLQKNYYESKMILSSDYLNKRLAESAIEKLDALAKEKNKHGLAKTLGISDSAANNIISFDVHPFIEEKDLIELEVLKEQLRNAQTTNNQKVIDQVVERIEIENRHAFEITVRTLTPSVIGNLQEAIVGYFERNPYIRKRIEINKQNLVEKKEKLERDIQKLDSLKYVIFENYQSMASQSRGSNNVILSDKSVTDPIEIYTKDSDIYSEYQSVTRALFLQGDFEIVDGFTEFSEPASASLATMVLYSIIIGVIIAYTDVALRSFNTYLANLK
ncbi:MAG TPA: hypothetical protein VF473_10040 [Cyclobacteriaceae bacterium]